MPSQSFHRRVSIGIEQIHPQREETHDAGQEDIRLSSLGLWTWRASGFGEILPSMWNLSNLVAFFQCFDIGNLNFSSFSVNETTIPSSSKTSSSSVMVCFFGVDHFLSNAGLGAKSSLSSSPNQYLPSSCAPAVSKSNSSDSCVSLLDRAMSSSLSATSAALDCTEGICVGTFACHHSAAAPHARWQLVAGYPACVSFCKSGRF